MPWLRSFAPRVAVTIAVVVLVASFLGAGWGWLRAQGALRQQLDWVLAAETEGLLRDFETYGLQGLAEAANVYTRRKGPLLVLLQTADGRMLAGHVPAAPSALRGFATLRPDGAVPLRALGAVLPGGINLVVATDLSQVDRAAAALAWTPPLAGGIAALLALGLGFLLARGLERRLAGVSTAAQGVMAGDLTRRLPLAGRGDEFDRLAGTINTMLGQIEALVAEVRQVTDDIAHDLRSPLSRLRQRLEAALARPREATADAALLEGAMADLDQILATFAALLRIARIEAGAGRESFAQLDLSALVAGMAEAYSPVIEEARRTLLLEIAPGQQVAGSAPLLRQAVANLLENALHHGAGTIGLALRPGPVLTVSDAGAGIPVGERQKVLRRFYRLDRSRGTPGTGLGLSLVAAVARLHGGSLILSDAPGASLHGEAGTVLEGMGLEARLALPPTAPD